MKPDPYAVPAFGFPYYSMLSADRHTLFTALASPHEENVVLAHTLPKSYLFDMNDRSIGYPILGALVLMVVGTWIYVAYTLNASPMYRVIRFDRIGNLRIDDPVRVKGVMIGEVESITPSNGKVAVTVRAYEPFDVYPGYRACVVDRGLMGDRAITIEQGDDSRAALAVRDTLEGRFYPGISEWIGQAWKLRVMVDSLNGVSTRLLRGTDGSPSFVEKFDTILTTTESLSEQLLELALIGRRELAPRLDTLNHLVDATVEVLEAAAAAGPEYIANVHEGLGKLERFVTKLEEALEGLSVLVAKLEDEEGLLWSERLVNVTKRIKELRLLIHQIGEGTTRLKLRISRLRD
jgi:ABC-type transporter Mla subunit MlaD